MFRALLLLLCITTVAAWHKCLSNAGAGVDISLRSDKNTIVKCTDPTFELFYILSDHVQVKGDEAMCSSPEGWSAPKSNAHDKRIYSRDESTTQFECRKVPPFCTFQEDVDGVHYDIERNRLTCRGENDTLHAIRFESEMYEAFSCERNAIVNEWRIVGAHSATKVGEASPPLVVACVQYCTSSGNGTKAGNVKDGILHVNCVNPGYELFYANKSVGAEAKCALDSGWWSDSEGKISTDTVAPMEFECREVSTPDTTTPVTTTERTSSATNITANITTTTSPAEKPNRNEEGSHEPSGAKNLKNNLPLMTGFSIVGVALLARF